MPQDQTSLAVGLPPAALEEVERELPEEVSPPPRRADFGSAFARAQDKKGHALASAMCVA